MSFLLQQALSSAALECLTQVSLLLSSRKIIIFVFVLAIWLIIQNKFPGADVLSYYEILA